MKRFFTFIWNLSEKSGIGLGRFAPFVFESMCGLRNSQRIQIISGKITKIKIRRAKK